MQTTIFWHQANRPNFTGFVEHHFEVSGPQAPLIHAWLVDDNKDHGEWRLNPRGHQRFQIWADLNDAAAVERVNGHVARLKAVWVAPEHLVSWKQR